METLLWMHIGADMNFKSVSLKIEIILKELTVNTVSPCTALFSGVLATRLGVRRLTMVGSSINGLATILGSFANNVTQLYLCGALSGNYHIIIPPTNLV